MPTSGTDDLKLLFVSVEYPPVRGGVGRYAANIVRGLEDGTVADVGVVTTGSSTSPDVGNVIRTAGLFNRKFLRLLPLLPVVFWQSLVHRPNFILAMTWTHDGLAAWIAGSLLRIPYVVHIHGSDIDPVRRGLLRRLLRWLIFKRATLLIANSEYTRRRIEESNLPRRSVVVITPSATRMSEVESSETNVALDVRSRSEIVLLTVARLVPRKGHATVLRALSDLGPTNLPIKYLIASDGPERAALEALANELGLGSTVEFIGEVSDARIGELYKSADIYVSPSIEQNGDVEGFGISFIEAALYGVPTIAGDSGGSAEAVVDGVTGFVVAPADEKALSGALLRIIEDPELMNRLGHAAMKRADENFSPQQKAEELLAILREL